MLISSQFKKLRTELLLKTNQKTKVVFWQKLALFAYSHFLRESVACWRLVCGNVNHFISRAFTAYLLVNCPLSCALGAMLLIKGNQFNGAFYIFTATFMLQQWVCTFAIHFLIVGVNWLIHQPVKLLMHLMGSNFQLKLQNCKIKNSTYLSDFRLQIKLDAYIAAYHVRSERRYGFSYWKLSLVTMMSFAEVSFFRF